MLGRRIKRNILSTNQQLTHWTTLKTKVGWGRQHGIIRRESKVSERMVLKNNAVNPSKKTMCKTKRTYSNTTKTSEFDLGNFAVK